MSVNEQRMAEWLKFKSLMLNLPGPVHPLSNQQVRDAVLGYLLRDLSRGRVPHLDALMNFLDGNTALPSCGFIGCLMDSQCGDHVH